MKHKAIIKIGIFEDYDHGWGASETLNVPYKSIKGRSDILAVYLIKYLKRHLEEILKEAK